MTAAAALRGPGSNRTSQRVVSIGRVIVYGFLAWTAAKVASTRRCAR